MRERPILMSAPMVRALLDGRKTQTRRVVKPQPEALGTCGPGLGGAPAIYWTSPRYDNGDGVHYFHTDEQRARELMVSACPYGVPGDRLWVKESLLCAPWQHRHDAITYAADHAFAWDADEPATWVWSRCGLSSLFMPRGLSRLTLTITDVRVERVQDINDDDAIAEGIPDYPDFKGDCPVDDYRELWDSLNAARGYGWDANPWVWALTFSVADCAAAGRVAA